MARQLNVGGARRNLRNHRLSARVARGKSGKKKANGNVKLNHPNMSPRGVNSLVRLDTNNLSAGFPKQRHTFTTILECHNFDCYLHNRTSLSKAWVEWGKLTVPHYCVCPVLNPLDSRCFGWPVRDPFRLKIWRCEHHTAFVFFFFDLPRVHHGTDAS